MAEREYLECPCCGDEGAYPHEDGYYYDGDPLACGCNGSVHADEGEAWINLNDEPCEPEARCNRD